MFCYQVTRVHHFSSLQSLCPCVTTCLSSHLALGISEQNSELVRIRFSCIRKTMIIVGIKRWKFISLSLSWMKGPVGRLCMLAPSSSGTQASLTSCRLATSACHLCLWKQGDSPSPTCCTPSHGKGVRRRHAFSL